jgi:hypothetical protein
MPPRDDFPVRVKRSLAHRVGDCCSNPTCRQRTAGPTIDPTGEVNIGVAAHITAAAAGGPRYQPSLPPEARKSIENGIWLCGKCAKLIDSDLSCYSIEVLRKWKQDAEERARAAIGGNQAEVSQRRPRVIVEHFTLIRCEDYDTGEEYEVEAFHLLNVGESPAVSIHIEIPEFLGQAVKLRGRPPAILPPGGEADLEVRNFQKLLESVQRSRPYERGWSVKIPLRVEYRELDHNRWSTNHAIAYTQFHGIAVEVVHPDDPPEWTDLAALAKAASRR